MFVEHKEFGEIQEAPAKVLNLSEAIRIGIERFPEQCRGAFFCGNDQACALGAAVYAKEGRKFLGFSFDWATYFRAPGPVIDEVTRRNDNGESRESIADWLESQGY